MNMSDEHWLQPDGMDSVLPEQAHIIESLRRELLDRYATWGYDMVVPPFLDFLPSLLSGTGSGLEQKTFKFVDPESGKMVGIRADMTPQVARIDAHELGLDVPVRLSYMGSVLHTSPDGFGGARSLLQLGVELYGEVGIHADVEVLMLMLETLSIAGVKNTHIDLGHVDVFRALAIEADLNASQEQQMYDALQRKAVADIGILVKEFGLSPDQSQWFLQLINLNGDASVLDDAAKIYSGVSTKIDSALSYLADMSGMIKQQQPELPLYFDLAELRGYHYHTGVVFAAFVPGHGRSIARGGRYDDIGKHFGRARPATGFSTDLKTLVSLSDSVPKFEIERTYAPHQADSELQTMVSELRAAGNCVVQGAESDAVAIKAQGYSQQIVRQDNKWVVVGLS